jgi:hypothetical protein
MPRGWRRRLDRRVGDRRVEEQVTLKSPYYNPDASPYIDNSIQRAARKLEELQLRKQIHAIDGQLQLLKSFGAMYPPPAGSEPPLGVHTAPSSDQETIV